MGRELRYNLLTFTIFIIQLQVGAIPVLSRLSDDEKLSWCKISTDTVCNTLKTHTKYAHIVRGRPTLKDVERFRNGSVREPYERSLYERTFMSEPFIEKHAISTELSNVSREKHRRKSHRVCRPDREPSRIPIRSLAEKVKAQEQKG